MNENSDLLPNLLHEEFEMQMRGYSRRQVDDFVARRNNEIRELEQRLSRSLDDSEQLRRELSTVRQQALSGRPAHEEVSERIAQILKLADDEAKAQKNKAEDDIAKQRSEAQQESERVRAEAREQAERMLTAAQEQAERTIAAARNEADKTRTAARTEADRLTSDTRKKAESALSQAKGQAKKVMDEATARATAIHDGAERRLNLLSTRHADTVRRLTDILDGVQGLVAAESARMSLEEEVNQTVSRAVAQSEAAADAAAAVEHADSGSLFFRHQLLCLLAVAQGDPERADLLLGRALADPALTRIYSSDARPVLVAGALTQRARLAHRTGEHVRQRVAERQAELAAADATLGVDGPFDRAWQIMLHALIEDDGWDRAAAAWRELRQPYELALSLFHGARAALAAGDRPGGTARLREAARLAEDLGAAPLTREIALLGRPRPAQDGLTEREHDVLTLIAEGLSNRQIAARLHISPSTAGVHVSHILTKLGAATRTEAAAIAIREGLAGSCPTHP